MMGGRGSSSASGRSAAAPAQQAPDAVSVPIQDVMTGLGGSHTLAEIQAMTDAEYDAYLDTLGSVDMPNFLADNDFQRFVYDAGVNDRPQVVDQATFDALPGTTMYRTVNSVYDRATDVGMSADQIAAQTMQSSLSRIGNGVYGDGFYFADSASASHMYGSRRGDVKRTAVMQAKLSPTANVVSYSQIMAQYMRDPSSSKRGIGSNSGLSMFALRKGYNVIDVGRNGYYNVLDRSALVMSASINPM